MTEQKTTGENAYEARRQRAWNQGAAAAEAGDRRNANPYFASSLRGAWFDGWDYASEGAVPGK
jgi:ribosome modulation factor